MLFISVFTRLKQPQFSIFNPAITGKLEVGGGQQQTTAAAAAAPTNLVLQVNMLNNEHQSRGRL